MKQIIITVILCATALIALRIAIPKTEKSQSVIEAIHARRSIRNYKECTVEREKLMEIARAGIAAPNAMNRQAWAVRIVDSKEWIDGCTKAFVATVKGTPLGEHLLTADFKNMFRNAPAVIIVAAEPTRFAGVDCGILAQNMMLAAWSMGVGSCCLGSVVPVMASEEAKPYLEMLQLPEGYKLLVAIAFGYPDCEIPEAPERDATKVMFL